MYEGKTIIDLVYEIIDAQHMFEIVAETSDKEKYLDKRTKLIDEIEKRVNSVKYGLDCVNEMIDVFKKKLND